MAVAFVRTHTAVSIKTAGTTNIGVNISTATSAGNTLVAHILFDNFTTASTPTVSSIAKAAGETNNWVFLGAARSTSTSAGAFGSGEMWAIRTTVSWPVASYTVTLSNSVTQKATHVGEFSGVFAALRSTSGTAYSTTTTAASATTTGTTPSIGDLALGFIFGSNVAAAQAGDNDTTGGSWSAAVGLGSTGSSGATNNFGVAQYKILTGASHQTLNNSAAMTAGNGAIVAILQQADTPSITQAAYRIYADGTESGSAVVAAQDTAYSASIDAGDVHLQVRTRLQSTSAVAVDPWDGFQLQWEKNASGSWTDVIPGPGVVDRYDDSNMTSLYSHTTSTWVMGQSFMGNGTNLSQAKFYFMSTGTPTGQLTAYLYAHTGVFGTSSNYTGTALATSTPVSESVIGEGPVWVAFDFDGSYQLVRGTPYVIAYKRSVTDSVNYVNPGFDNSSPTAAGNLTTINVPYAGEDFIFEVSGIGGASGVGGYNPVSLTEGAATTNRLTGGTGTFVAGKVSEDGLVDGLGWSGNNYTELLYSLTLKAADLANGDTLRFRVLRNGATTGLTYTQTPTISITKASFAITQAAYRFYADDMGAPTLLDSYPSSNHSITTLIFGTATSIGQSFLGDGKALTRAGFYIRKSGAPTGTIAAKLWAHTGTFGSGGTATGTELATSTTTMSVASLSTTLAWAYFDFDPVVLGLGVPYVVTVSGSVTGDADNNLGVGADYTSPAHAGNESLYNGGWTTPANDVIFEVYTSESTSLAAQDATPTISLDAGDVVGQVRVLLQSTTGVPGDSTDDYFLEWEKNASGTWMMTGLSTAEAYSVSVSQQSILPTTHKLYGQTFLGNGKRLGRWAAYVQRVGTPAGNFQARVYAHTGTFGSGGMGTGPPLATVTYAYSSVSTSVGWFYFVFATNSPLLENGVPYCVVMGGTAAGDGTNYVTAGRAVTPSHAGNATIYDVGTDTWSATADDYIFTYYTFLGVGPRSSAYVTEGEATANRLTGGTGSFAAGKASEDGVVNDFAITGNAYTELLYTFILKRHDFADGDTVRLRVNRNQATTGFTYTKYPTISIAKAPLAIAQDAYRFYADGTETGSTALAAQNAALAVDISSGDVHRQLRMRLQSTTAAYVDATDDFRLQWEKNSSGTWTDVVDPRPIEYPTVLNTLVSSTLAISNYGRGESFLGNGRRLLQAQMMVRRDAGSPTGNTVMNLFAHTGTYGNEGTATGAALATSTRTTASFSTSAQWESFDFDGSFTLEKNTPYVISIHLPSAAVAVTAVGDSPGSWSGNGSVYNGSTWSGSAAGDTDTLFRVITSDPTHAAGYDSPSLTDAAATTNRLTGGTGTFTPGEISETGLVTDLGWSGNNYTELLYSLTLKAADLVDGDTLRFRILRNGATTDLTYTQTPTITIAPSGLTYSVTDGMGLSDSVTIVRDFGRNYSDIASSLRDGGSNNLLGIESSFETDISADGIADGWRVPTGAETSSVSAPAAQSLVASFGTAHGAKSQRISSAGAGTFGLVGPMVPVVLGTKLFIRSLVSNPGGSAVGYAIGFLLYDSGQVYSTLSQTTGGVSAGTSQSVSHTYTGPAGFVYAAPFVSLQSASSSLDYDSVIVRDGYSDPGQPYDYFDPAARIALTQPTPLTYDAQDSAGLIDTRRHARGYTFDNGTHGQFLDVADSTIFSGVEANKYTFTRNTQVGGLGIAFDSRFFGLASMSFATSNVAYLSMRVTETAHDAGGNVWLAAAYSGATMLAQVRVTNTGAVQLRDTTTAVDTSTMTISTNTDYRFEWQINKAAGTQVLRIYAGWSTSVIETLTGSCTNAAPTTVDSIAVGTVAASSSGTAAGTFIIDDIGWSRDGYIGPISPFTRSDSAGLIDSISTGLTTGVVIGRPKSWSGTAHVEHPGKVWNGTAWVERRWKLRTATEWEYLGGSPS